MRNTILIQKVNWEIDAEFYDDIKRWVILLIDDAKNIAFCGIGKTRKAAIEDAKEKITNF